MTFSYNPADLASAEVGSIAGSTKGARYRVRLMLGDVEAITTQANRHLEDEEIDWRLSTVGNDELHGAVLSGEDLLAKWSHREVATVQSAMDQRWQNLRERVAGLRARLEGRAGIAAGGISVSAKDAAESDTDRDRPSFQRELLDNPDAIQPNETRNRREDKVIG